MFLRIVNGRTDGRTPDTFYEVTVTSLMRLRYVNEPPVQDMSKTFRAKFRCQIDVCSNESTTTHSAGET